MKKYENMTFKVKVILAGSREFTNYEVFRHWVIKTLSDWGLTDPGQIIIVSGGARGTDRMGERFAHENNIELHRFQAQWDKYGKSAGYIRNKEMAVHGDLLIAFRKGPSVGTNHMINIASEMGLDKQIYNVK